MLWIVRMLTNNAEIAVFSIINRFTWCPIFLVSSYFRMSRMLSCHKAGTGWSTHWCTCIRLCKTHTFLCHTVNIRCKDVLLTIAAKVAIAHIITHDIYNVRLLLFFRSRSIALYTSKSCEWQERFYKC